ncbi:hypothetical protein ATER59S_05254 [Aquamicrobium terrae]
MEFEWDRGKADSNLGKHGVDFSDAAGVFEDTGASHVLDETMDYGEDRFRAVGIVKGTVLVVVYVERGERIRIISARKATKREEHDHLAERWAGQDRLEPPAGHER